MPAPRWLRRLMPRRKSTRIATLADDGGTTQQSWFCRAFPSLPGCNPDR